MFKLLRFLRTLFYLAACGIVVWFAVVNREPVTISIIPLPYEVTLPLSFLALAIFVLGICIGYAFSLSGSYRAYRQIKRERRKNAALESEVESLRVERTVRPVAPGSLSLPLHAEP